MKRATNKKGTKGYGKFIDTYRKTLPLKAKDGHGKKHKRKLNKAETDFAVAPSTKIVSKFAQERSAEENSMQSKKETMPNPVMTTEMFTKSINSPEAYAKWLESYRRTHAATQKTPPQATGISRGQSHSALLNSARQGDISVLAHPDAHNLRDAQGDSLLHHLAKRNKTEVMSNEYAHTTKNKLGQTPLHLLGERKNEAILGHPYVSTVMDQYGDSPLHYLARTGSEATLSHPDISSVKNFKGRSPLHSAAFARTPGVEKHPDYNIVRDINGRTPQNIFEGTSGLEPVEPIAKGVEAFNKAFFGTLEKSDPIKKQYSFKGIPIKIEWPMGKVRKYGKNNEKDGEIMKADYGYIANTISPDGEEIDVYCGPNKKSDKLFLMLQKPTPYDVEHGFTEPEEKYMLGFDSIEEAEKAFKDSMPSKWFKSIKEISYDDLHKKIKSNTLTKDHELKKGYITRKQLMAYVDKAVSVTDGQDMEKLTEKPQPGTLGIPESFANNALDHSTTLDKGIVDAEEEGFRNAQENLKKDIEDLPDAAADQGNRERGPVYSFGEDNSFQKGRTSKRLKIADKLDEIVKANAFVSNDGFVPRKEEELPANSFESKPFVSVKKALDKMFKKSDMVSQGMLKYEKLNQIYRTKGRPDRLINEETSENSEANRITKSLVSMQRTINRIPRLVFEL